MRSEPLASVDGRITPTAEAVIPLADDGVYRGDGAFEVIRLYGGKPFALDEHLERLERSAEAIDLDFDGEALRTEIDALLDRHGDEDAIVRVLVTRGGRRIASTTSASRRRSSRPSRCRSTATPRRWRASRTGRR